VGYLCSNPWTTAFVWGDGSVTHCCYSNIGPLGNINRTPLAEIWHGKKIGYVRGKILAGRYTDAGCEYFCRVFRWNEYYGGMRDKPSIPEGLGRIEDFSAAAKPALPSILGIAIDAKCNLKCTHCLSSNDAPGISDKNLEDLWPAVRSSKIVRLVNGEFSINRRALDILRGISSIEIPPRVFLNTNGTVDPNVYLDAAGTLPSFHLKFSLEGMGAAYEKVRVGAKWELFLKHLHSASESFRLKQAEGRDWKLYLNFCVMRSNFEAIPQILEFAIERNLPLVLNTLNGMRHIDENMFMYAHLAPGNESVERVRGGCERLPGRRNYFFAEEFGSHLEYIFRVLADKKLDVPYSKLKRIIERNPGRTADRKLTLLYKWKFDKKGFFLYIFRKLRKRLFNR